jgi:hypothetical protein
VQADQRVAEVSGRIAAPARRILSLFSFRWPSIDLRPDSCHSRQRDSAPHIDSLAVDVRQTAPARHSVFLFPLIDEQLAPGKSKPKMLEKPCF